LSLYCERRSVGLSVLVSGTPLRPMTRFFFCRTFALLFVLGRLSDERTGLQSVSGQSRGGLVTIHFCLNWDYWVPFPSPLTTRRDYGGSILARLHTGKNRMGTQTSIFIYVAVSSLKEFWIRKISSSQCQFCSTDVLRKRRYSLDSGPSHELTSYGNALIVKPVAAWSIQTFFYYLLAFVKSLWWVGDRISWAIFGSMVVLILRWRAVCGFALLQGPATYTGHFIRAANFRKRLPSRTSIYCLASHASLYMLTWDNE
jgi:hypothetical protein